MWAKITGAHSANFVGYRESWLAGLASLKEELVKITSSNAHNLHVEETEQWQKYKSQTSPSIGWPLSGDILWLSALSRWPSCFFASTTSGNSLAGLGAMPTLKYKMEELWFFKGNRCWEGKKLQEIHKAKSRRVPMQSGLLHVSGTSLLLKTGTFPKKNSFSHVPSSGYLLHTCYLNSHMAD